MDRSFEIRKSFNAVVGQGDNDRFDSTSLSKYVKEIGPYDAEVVAEVWALLDPHHKGVLTLSDFTKVYDTFVECMENLKNTNIPRSSSLKTLQKMNRVGSLKDQFEDEEEKSLIEAIQYQDIDADNEQSEEEEEREEGEEGEESGYEEFASDSEDKNRLLEQAAAREQSLKDQLSVKSLQLQALKESLLTKSNELGTPPAPLEPAKSRSIASRGRTNSMSDVPLTTSIPAKDARDFHNKSANLDKIEREIGEKSKTLALLNKQLFRRSGSYSSVTGSEPIEGLQSSASFPDDVLNSYSQSPKNSPKNSPKHSPAPSPPSSPSPGFRGVSSFATDAMYTELQEVRALRDKLQSQLVKRREDNEILQQQLINAQGEMNKKQTEVDSLRQQLQESHINGRDLAELLSQAKQEFEEKSITMTQVLEEMRQSHEELQGAQLNLAGPIAEKFEELHMQLYNSQSVNADLQLQVSQLNTELNRCLLTIQTLESTIISLKNAKTDLERKSILVVADSKQFSIQLEEVKKHHESDLERMHFELQKMIKEAAEERKARKRAEQLLQEAEDEAHAFRKERESRLQDSKAKGSKDSAYDSSSPFEYLLQKARDKNASLEDSVSSLQAQILTLQSEAQGLRTEISILREEAKEKTKKPDTNPRSATKGTETERIMDLKRQLSLSELGNLAKLAETELINSRLTFKISELEVSLRHASDAAARAEFRVEESEMRMQQITAQLSATGEQLHGAGEKLRGVFGDDKSLVLKDKIRELESDLEVTRKEKQTMEIKISQLQEDVRNFEKSEQERRAEVERQRESLAREAKQLRERTEMEQTYEEYSNKIDSILADEQKTNQTKVEDFANNLHTDLQVAEENLSLSHQLAERVRALEAKDTELVSTKDELDKAVERVEEVEDELENAKRELEIITSALEVGKMEVKGFKGELTTMREENTRLQQLNGLMVTRLGNTENELAIKVKELEDAKSEILALQSTIEAKQKYVGILENERTDRLAAVAVLEQEKDDALTKLSQIQAELKERIQAIELLNKSKMELEQNLALEKKITEDIRHQNSLLASQMESKQGDLGGLVAQVSKLTEQLHAQEKITSDLRVELQHETTGKHEADAQSKQLMEKIVELEAVSARLNTELTQQLSHLRAESDSKSKAIFNLEANIDSVNSQLTQTRKHLDEAAKTANEKAELIAQMKAQVSNYEQQQEQTKIEREKLSASALDATKSLVDMNIELARRSEQLSALQKSFSEKSEVLSELESRLESVQNALEFATQQTSKLTHDLDTEKKEHAVDEARHKVTIESLVSIIEDIYRRLNSELSHSQPQPLPDLAAYFSRSPNREVVSAMDTRKEAIDAAINQMKSNGIQKSQAEQRLLDITALLEAEKLNRAKLEGEKTQVVADLDKRTASLKAMELEAEARAVLAQQMGQQLFSTTGDEGLPIIVTYLDTTLSSANPPLSQAFRNILHSSQLKTKDISDLRVQIESAKDNLQSKVKELETKTLHLAATEDLLVTKTRELAASQAKCDELTTKLKITTQQHESVQSGLAQHAQEELSSLRNALSDASAGKTILEQENKQLHAEKAKLEADYKNALARLDMLTAERRQLLEMWGAKESLGVNVVLAVAGGKDKLENELEIQRVQRKDIENRAAKLFAEVEQLRMDLGMAEAERANAIEKLAQTANVPQITATARRSTAQQDTLSSAPGSALASTPPPSFPASPAKQTFVPPFTITPLRPMQPTGLAAAPANLAAAAQQKRTLALGGIGLGQVLKTFMTEHSAIPEDLEIVDTNNNNNGIVRRSIATSRSSTSGSAVDEDEDREEMLRSLKDSS